MVKSVVQQLNMVGGDSEKKLFNSEKGKLAVKVIKLLLNFIKIKEFVCLSIFP